MAKLLKKHFTGKDIFMQYCYLSQEKNWTKHEDDWINEQKKNPKSGKKTLSGYDRFLRINLWLVMSTT